MDREKSLLVGFAVVVVVFFVLLVLVLATSSGGPLLGNVVGVLPVKGEMVSDSSDSIMGSTVGVRDLIKQLEKADEDPSVSAILLDINSGGGSAVAGKELMRAIRNTKKPVVAYIGEVGASSAYLVASAADEVIADEDSLTGSIGAVSLVSSYAGLLEKIGVNITVITGGENKGMLNPYEEISPEHKAMMGALVDDAYLQIKEEVRTNRGDKLVGFDEIADGRVLNGRQALKAGLVDELGSRNLALERAAELGGIDGEPYERVFYPTASPFAGIFSEVGFDLGKGLLLGLQSGRMQLRA